MRYPVAIESGTSRKAVGIVVPDLPGCYSAGDSLDEALANAREAIEAWIETALDIGAAVPAPSSLETLRRKRSFRGWAWALVEVDLGSLHGRAVRLNVSLPARIVRRVDAHVARRGESRSGFLARAALAAVAAER